MRKEQIVIDIDGTLTVESQKDKDIDFYRVAPIKMAKKFDKSVPNKNMIKKVNELSKKYVICIWTSRSDVFQDVTIRWLKKHKVKYDFLQMGKPFAKYYVDDKFMSPDMFLNM